VFEVTYNCHYLLSDYIPLWLFIFISFVLLFLLLLFVKKSLKRSLFTDIGFFLISLGGLSNIYEWVNYGCVKDYFNFLGLFKFNISDFLISIGIVLLITFIWKKK